MDHRPTGGRNQYGPVPVVHRPAGVLGHDDSRLVPDLGLEPFERLEQRHRLRAVLLHQLGDPVGEVEERSEEHEREAEQAARDHVRDLLEQVRGP